MSGEELTAVVGVDLVNDKGQAAQRSPEAVLHDKGAAAQHGHGFTPAGGHIAKCRV